MPDLDGGAQTQNLIVKADKNRHIESVVPIFTTNTTYKVAFIEKKIAQLGVLWLAITLSNSTKGDNNVPALG